MPILRMVGLAFSIALSGCADHTWCMSWLETPDGSRSLGPIVTPYCGHRAPNYGLVPVCQYVKKLGDDSYIAVGPKQACP
jgi:hypothetical protein